MRLSNLIFVLSFGLFQCFSNVYALTFLDSQVNASNGVSGLAGASDLVISPDANHLYASGFGGDSVALFSITANTGQLSFISQVQNGSNGVSGLNGANALLLSPDGKHLYVASILDNAIAIFSRDASTGALSFISATQDGDNGADGLSAVNNLAFSSDGAHLYATSSIGLLVFSRDSSSGALSFIEKHQSGVSGVSGISGASAVNLFGSQVYVAGSSASAIALFNRDSSTGALTFATHYANGTNDIIGLGGAYDVLISPDGSRVFASGNTDNAIVVFNRNSSGGALSFSNVYQDGVSGIDGLLGVRGLASSPDGQQLYASGNSENALAVFDVLGATATESLNFTEVQRDSVNGVSNLIGINNVVISSDNRNVYSTALSSNAVDQFSVIAADLSLAMTAPTQGQINSDLVYTLNIANLGADTADSVSLSDSLPNGTTFISAIASQGSCSDTGSVVNCDIGNMAAGANVTITITIRTSSPSSLTNIASVSSIVPDTQSSNNNATATINVLTVIRTADLNLDFAVSSNPINIGTTYSYTATALNQGPDSADNVSISVTLPTGVGFISVTSGQGTCTTAVNQSVRCDIGGMANTASVDMVVTLLSPGISNSLTASASIQSDQIDPDGNDNNRTLNSQVDKIITDLTVLSLTAPSTANLGETLTFNASLANIGTNDTDAIFLDVLFSPANGQRFLSSSTTHPNAALPLNPCVEVEQGRLSCSLGLLQKSPAASAPLQFSVQPLLSGSLSAEVTVRGNAFDIQADNNLISAAATITGTLVDLSLSASVSPTPAAINSPLVYTVVVSNSDLIETATGVEVSDTLPANVDFIGVLTSQGSCTEVGGVVTCAVGDIPPSSSATVSLTLRPTTENNVQNTINLSATSFDPDTSNNRVVISTDVGAANADLSTTINLGAETVTVGAEVSYIINVQNAGPAQASSTTFITTLAEGLTFIDASANNGGACAEQDNTLTCDLGTIDKNGAVSVTLRVLTQSAGIQIIAASTNASQNDPNNANDSDSSELRVDDPQSLLFVTTYIDGREGIEGLNGVNELIQSPDGRFVYAVGFRDNAVVTFSRDTDTGELSLLQVIQNPNGDFVGLTRPADLSLSGDNTALYVTGFSDNSLGILSRDINTGLLTPISALQQGVGGVTHLVAPYGVTSVDNHIYVASLGNNDTPDAISAFQRDPANNQIIQIDTYINGVAGVSGLGGANNIQISPDGSQVYAVSIDDDALVVFDRNPSTGALSFVQKHTDPNMLDPVGVTVSPDNNFIYVSASASHAIAIFQRSNNQLSLSQILSGVGGLTGVQSTRISLDGLELYSAGTNDNTLGIYSRDLATGGLTQTSQLRDGASGVDSLAGIRSLLLSDDGKHIYTAALSDNAISLFRLPGADISVSITVEPPQANTGQNFTYSLTVLNNGPDQATSISLSNILPDGLNLIGSVSSQGAPCAVIGQNITCQIGGLASGSNATVALTVNSAIQNIYQNTANVSASQIDPNTGNNSASVDTIVLGTANLQLDMLSPANPSLINSRIIYAGNIINAGPDLATTVSYSQTLPSNATFVLATLDGKPCDTATGQIICAPINLASQAQASIEVIFESGVEAAILNSTAVVTANQNDPTLPNQINFETKIVLNVIDTLFDNRDNTLENFIIAPSGIVNNGNIAGNTDNKGQLNNITHLSGGVIVGGTLNGVINNQGVLENVQLGNNTQIIGGAIQGTISGNPNAPASLITTIRSGTQLSHVIIKSGSTLEAGVNLGVGVRFDNNASIPAGLNLSQLLGMIPVSGLNTEAVNLNTDVLNGGNILNSINSLPFFSDNNFRVTQSSNGIVQLIVATSNFSFLPTQVIQAPPEAPSDLGFNRDGSIQVVTDTKRVITLFPSLDAPDTFATFLAATNRTAQQQNDGSISIRQNASSRFLFRPDMLSSLASVVGTNAALGEFVEIPAALLPNVNHLAFLYTDAFGTRRQQNLYGITPTIAVWLNVIGAEIDATGVASLVSEGNTHRGLFDYRIGNATADNILHIDPISDQNADEIADFRVLYPDGETQTLYYLPPPDLATEIQAIPAVIAQGFSVRLNAVGQIELSTADGRRWLLATGALLSVAEGTPQSLTQYPDGSFTFITASATQINAQPLLQDINTLNAALSGLDLSNASQNADGNWVVSLDTGSRIVLRAENFSSSINNASPVGLNISPNNISNGEILVLNFNDGNNMRQQRLYPAADDSAGLGTFLRAQAGVVGVNFYNDGTLEVIGGTAAFSGNLTYKISLSSNASGNVSLTNVPDISGDGIADRVINYASGNSQFVFLK